jgi:bifunctional enzyme CysN/CysC
VTITLADEIDLARGDMLVDPRDRPTVTRRLSADLVWMDDVEATPNKQFFLKIGTATVPARLTKILDELDIHTLNRKSTSRLVPNGIGAVEVETAAPIAFDSYNDNRDTGAFILIDRATLATAAAGMARRSLNQATNVYHHPELVSAEMRAHSKNQQAMVVWFTGLPSAGKSTIANLVETKLVAAGFHTMLLDGDNLRQGLNADLGFDVAARSENVRRVGEVARLMADAGLIVLVALVSPFRADRERAAALMPEGRFLEVFVDTPVEVCRQRDNKGLYAKALKGKLSDVTGKDQVYEPPLTPDLTLSTVELGPNEAADRVVTSVMRIAPAP